MAAVARVHGGASLGSVWLVIQHACRLCRLDLGSFIQYCSLHMVRFVWRSSHVQGLGQPICSSNKSLSSALLFLLASSCCCCL